MHYVVLPPYSTVPATSCLDLGVQFVNLLPESIAQLRPLGLERRRQQAVLHGEQLGLQRDVPHLHRPGG